MCAQWPKSGARPFGYAAASPIVCSRRQNTFNSRPTIVLLIVGFSGITMAILLFILSPIYIFLGISATKRPLATTLLAAAPVGQVYAPGPVAFD
jgi:hypothetical protein